MKRQIGSALLSCVMGVALLGGCAITALPTSEPVSQSIPHSVPDEEVYASSGTDTNQTAPPGDTTAPSEAEATPDQTPPNRAETVVYAQGNIAADGDALFEVPGELDADSFHTFAYFLTVAVPTPLASIEDADSETAFRLSRCMLEYFCMTHSDICNQVVYRETDAGGIRNYTVIPASDFLTFATSRLGIESFDFFENAIPADDQVVRFALDADQILFVPSMEWAASDFSAGYVEIQGDRMQLHASSESKGERIYTFDISNGVNSYRLVNVD